MASPRENTEIVRMLRDFKEAIYKSGPPRSFSSPAPARGFQRSSRQKSTAFEASDSIHLAKKLDFSNVDDPTRTICIAANQTQTPEQMKRKLIEAKVELEASKAALKEKETIITMMEPANKKICISLEQKLEESKKQNEMDQNTIAHLKTQLKHAQNEAFSARSRALECEKDKRIECQKLDMKLLALQQENSDLKLQLSDLKTENIETSGKMKQEIVRLEWKLATMKEECCNSKSFIATLKKQMAELSEKSNVTTQLQEDLAAAQAQIMQLESKIAANEDAAVFVESMQSELKAMAEIQKENRLLKEELSKYKESNVALFQEKMWAFQEKLAQAEKKNVALAKLQIENETLKSKLEEWESLLDDDDGATPLTKSPSAFSRKLSGYQKNEMLLTNRVTTLGARCENLEKKNKALEATIDQLKKSSDQIKSSSSGYETLVRRLQRKIFLLSKERDNCRKLIDSYVSESTLSGNALNTQHMKTLEDSIEDYKKTLDQADEEIESLGGQVKELSESKKNLEQLVKQLQEEKLQLMASLTEIKDADASEAKSAGSVDQKTDDKKEKIIHFRFNPYDEAIKKKAQDIKSLQEENDRLKKRVKVLEEGAVGMSDVTAIVSEKLKTEGSESELKTLKEQLATYEKQNKLIIETARSASKEFRSAVYSLTGFRVDSPGSGKFRISSLFADSPNDFLLFEINAEGVHLMENDYSKQLTSLIETYLRTYDSVPAFLASLTLDLFKQQTIMSQ